jgi:hypothetical protein
VTHLTYLFVDYPLSLAVTSFFWQLGGGGAVVAARAGRGSGYSLGG